jgi:hypothetical protein
LTGRERGRWIGLRREGKWEGRLSENDSDVRNKEMNLGTTNVLYDASMSALR